MHTAQKACRGDSKAQALLYQHVHTLQGEHSCRLLTLLRQYEQMRGGEHQHWLLHSVQRRLLTVRAVWLAPTQGHMFRLTMCDICATSAQAPSQSLNARR